MPAPTLLRNHDDHKKKGSLWDALGKFFASEPSKPLAQPNKEVVVVTTTEPQNETLPFSYNLPGAYAWSQTQLVNFDQNQKDKAEQKETVKPVKEESKKTTSTRGQSVQTRSPKKAQPNPNISIVDFLKAQGFKDTSLAYRKKLAEYYEIKDYENYTGTAEQNRALLKAAKADDAKPYKLAYDYVSEKDKTAKHSFGGRINYATMFGF